MILGLCNAIVASGFFQPGSNRRRKHAVSYYCIDASIESNTSGIASRIGFTLFADGEVNVLDICNSRARGVEGFRRGIGRSLGIFTESRMSNDVPRKRENSPAI